MSPSHTFFGLILFANAAIACAQSESIFHAEYEVILTIGNTQYRDTNDVRITEVQPILIAFARHKVELMLSSYRENLFLAVVTVFEQFGDGWIPLNKAGKGFGGKLGSDNTYDWNGEDARLNMAIHVSRSEE